MTATSFLIRACASYLVGISLASALASLTGGSTLLLILYSLSAGFPFFVAAVLLGLALRGVVAAHPAVSAAAVPIVTGMVWFALDMSMGDLLNATRVGLYAIFCAATCAAVFYAMTWRWPLR